MKKILLLSFIVSAFSFASKAQDTVKTTSDAPLIFTGSVDTYYKYDFSGHPNIGTYFGTDQNSVSIGMIDLALKKKVGKASFVGELGFGPRGQYQSTYNGDQSYGNAGNSFHIQNLYVSYDVTSKFNLTAGFMATFVGYEVISPTGNFNYSTSYLFGSGPFQNAGFKATYAFSDKVSLMAGIFNNYWNAYTSFRNVPAAGGNAAYVASGDVSTFGAQLMVVPVKDWTAYINFATGPYSGTILDLTTAYQITTAFKLGLNGATFTPTHGGGGYDGVALYPQLAVSKAVTLGVRGEYFEVKAIGSSPSTNVTAITGTANIKAGPLTLIPEIRFDTFGGTSKPTPFMDSNGVPSSSASQFILAAVFAF